MTPLSDSEDEFPELDVLLRRTRLRTEDRIVENGATTENASVAKPKTATTSRRPVKSKAGHAPVNLRRVKLGQTHASSNALLAPWTRTETTGVANERQKTVAGQTRTNDGNPRKLLPDSENDEAQTPPRTAMKAKARPVGLVSPKKLARIPTTPHPPSSDMFWSQEFMDEWNDEHSPKKELFKSATTDALPASPRKAGAKTAQERDAKKQFDQTKHSMAEGFLRELDAALTDGKIAELAATTGGVKIVWSGKLQTTAGRATWRRETLKQRVVGEAEPKATNRHYAAIELAEKVISNEERLLNVLAHEFCHLANFMVSGVINHPHGKTFKTWAAKCTRMFAHRGVTVTTKHTYEIDFKYCFQCTSCGLEFKRHSKSINVQRHRCGECKGELKQTRPEPRAKGKTSEYQTFMKEQMKLIKEQNPGSPQKDMMKQVAEKWSRVSKTQGAKSASSMAEDTMDVVTRGLNDLVVVDD